MSKSKLIVLLSVIMFLWSSVMVSAQTRTIAFSAEVAVTEGDETTVYSDNSSQIYFHPKAQNGWDVYDASKLTPLGSKYIMFGFLGSRLGETRYKVQESRPLFLAEDVVIPVKMEFMQVTGTVTIGITSTVNIPDSWDIFVKDTETDSLHDLRQNGSYQFDQLVLEHGHYEAIDQRFEVHLKTHTGFHSDEARGSEGWNMLAWPVTGHSVSDLAEFGAIQGITDLPNADEDSNIFTMYDGTDWLAAGADDELAPGKGFIWYGFQSDPFMADFTSGEVSYDDMEQPLHANGDKWNLLGNSWFYPIDTEDFETVDGELASIVAAWWDPDAGEGLGSYKLSTAHNGLIPPLTGFFMENDDAESLIIPNTAQRIPEDGPELSSGNFTSAEPLIIRGYNGGEFVFYDESLLVTQNGSGQKMRKPQSMRAFNVDVYLRTENDTRYAQLDAIAEDEIRICVTGNDIPDSITISSGQLFIEADGKYQDLSEGVVISNIRNNDCYPLSTPSVVNSTTGEKPTSFKVSTYPNPFNPVTQIQLQLPQSGMVRITVYDIQGRRVADLHNRYTSAGSHTVPWDATEFSSGVYLYRVHTEMGINTGKLMLIK